MVGLLDVKTRGDAAVKHEGYPHSTMTGHSNQVRPLTCGHINDGFDNPPVFDELLGLNAFLAEFATLVIHA